MPAALPTIWEGRQPCLVTATYFLQPLEAFGLGREAVTYSLDVARVCPPKSGLRWTRLLTRSLVTVTVAAVTVFQTNSSLSFFHY